MADLKEYGFNIPTCYWNPLLRSVYYGDVAGTLEAIAAGYDVNDRTSLSFNALHLAALLNRCEIGVILLQNFADINSTSTDPSLEHNGSTALMLAAGRGHIEFVRLLLINGADYNANGCCKDAISNAEHKCSCKNKLEFYGIRIGRKIC